MSITVVAVPNVSRFGAVEVSNNRVIAFREKGQAGPGLINAGTYVLRRSLLDQFADDRAFSLEAEFLVPEVARLRPLAWRSAGRFIDIGVPEDYEASALLLAPDRNAP